MALHVQVRRQYRSDWSGDSIMITQSSSFAIYRAGIHAASALYTLQRVTEIRTTQLAAATGVDQNDVHFLSGSWLSVVAGVDGDWSADGAAGQYTKEDTEMLFFGNEFLKAHRGYVNVGEMRSHIGVAFVGTYDELPRFSDGEVDACERAASREKDLPQVFARCARE